MLKDADSDVVLLNLTQNGTQTVQECTVVRRRAAHVSLVGNARISPEDRKVNCRMCYTRSDFALWGLTTGPVFAALPAFSVHAVPRARIMKHICPYTIAGTGLGSQQGSEGLLSHCGSIFLSVAAAQSLGLSGMSAQDLFELRVWEML